MKKCTEEKVPAGKSSKIFFLLDVPIGGLQFYKDFIGGSFYIL